MPPSSLPLLPLLLILALPSAHPLPTNNAIQKVLSLPFSVSLSLPLSLSLTASAHPLPSNAIQKVFSWPLSRFVFVAQNSSCDFCPVQCTVVSVSLLSCHYRWKISWSDVLTLSTFVICPCPCQYPRKNVIYRRRRQRKRGIWKMIACRRWVRSFLLSWNAVNPLPWPDYQLGDCLEYLEGSR